jgi:ATP-dependent DNA helicase RecQ
LLGISDLVANLNALEANKWTGLIADGIAALTREIAKKTMPVLDLVE